jgi:hypothetical protein
MKLVHLFAFLLVSSNAQSATPTFYVSPAGNDSYSGASPAAAFATVERARDAARLARTVAAPAHVCPVVLLEGGVAHRLHRTLNLTSADSGVAGVCNASWSSYGVGGRAQLSGGMQIRDWTAVPAPAPGGLVLWHAVLPLGQRQLLPFTQLFVNGRRATRARSPNLGQTFSWQSTPCNAHGDCCSSTSAACSAVCMEARRSFTYRASDEAAMPPQSQLNSSTFGGGRVNAVVFHGWTASRHYVGALNATSRSVSLLNPSDRPIGFWPDHDSEGGGRYFLENYRSALDAEGEWWLDEDQGVVWYAPTAADGDAGSAEAVAPIGDGRAVNGVSSAAALVELLRVDGASDLYVGQIELAHAAWACGEDQVCDHQSASWQTVAALHVGNGSARVHFEHVAVRQVGGTAVWLDTGSSDVSLRHSSVDDVGAGGVRVGANQHAGAATVARIAVHNCSIAGGGRVTPAGTGVLVQQAREVSITQCDIGDFSYTGISLGWSWNYSPQPGSGAHVVEGNRIHHLGSSLRDEALGDAMACVYTLGLLDGTVVRRNLCHDVYAYFTGGYCLSQDQGSSDILFDSNVCLRTTGSPQNQHYGLNNTYTNNIFADGFHDSWVGAHECKSGCAAGLRTSPHTAHDPVYTNASTDGVPNSLSFVRNLVVHRNASGALFEGNWNQTHPQWRYAFASNSYASSALDLRSVAVFGGCSERSCGAAVAFALTWEQWQASGMDTDGQVLRGSAGLFSDPNWRASLNVTMPPDSPVLKTGFNQIDTGGMGLLPGWAPTLPPTPAPTPPTPPPTPAPPTPAPTPHPSALQLGQSMALGMAGALWSSNSKYVLVLQGDSNLCERPATPAGSGSGSGARWCAMSNGTNAVRATFQTDGNFCVRNAAGRGVWCTGTAGAAASQTGSTAALLGSGCFCVLGGADGMALWCSKAACAPLTSSVV